MPTAPATSTKAPAAKPAAKTTTASTSSSKPCATGGKSTSSSSSSSATPAKAPAKTSTTAKTTSASKPPAASTEAATKTTPPPQTAPAPAPAPAAPALTRVALKQFPTAVIEDLTLTWRPSGKWPLILDESQKVAIFLTYRASNELDMLSRKDFEPESIRIRLLGALRFGKVMMLNIHDITDMYFVENSFNAVQPNLWADIMSKKIVEKEVYEKLIRPDVDGDEYRPFMFQAKELFDFIFMIVASPRFPKDHPLCQTCFPILVYNPDEAVKKAHNSDDEDDS